MLWSIKKDAEGLINTHKHTLTNSLRLLSKPKVKRAVKSFGIHSQLYQEEYFVFNTLTLCFTKINLQMVFLTYLLHNLLIFSFSLMRLLSNQSSCSVSAHVRHCTEVTRPFPLRLWNHSSFTSLICLHLQASYLLRDKGHMKNYLKTFPSFIFSPHSPSFLKDYLRLKRKHHVLSERHKYACITMTVQWVSQTL